MRSFVISVIILSLILGTSIYTTRKTEDIALQLLELLSNLESEQSAEAYDKYLRALDRHQTFFDITMPKNKSIQIIEGTALIESALASDSSSDLLHGINMSKAAILSIYESNKTNFKNIL